MQISVHAYYQIIAINYTCKSLRTGYKTVKFVTENTDISIISCVFENKNHSKVSKFFRVYLLEALHQSCALKSRCPSVLSHYCCVWVTQSVLSELWHSCD